MATITLTADKDIRILSPDCFEEFSCKGGACRNTCCKEWRIDISRAEYNKIRKLCSRSKNLSSAVNDFFERVPRKLATDSRYAKVKFTEAGYCPMFSEEGLCKLQLELGYPVLPQICKDFPRLQRFLNEHEIIRGLDLSCERTLELLLKHMDTPLHFTYAEPATNMTFRKGSTDIYPEHASDIRNLCILIMQNRAYSLSDRMILLGIAVRELHEIHENNTPERLPDWFARNMALTKGDDMKEALQGIPGNQERFVLNNLRFFRFFYHEPSLRFLFDRISNTIEAESPTAGNYSYNPESYIHAKATFSKKFPEIDNFFENCIVMLMFYRTFPLTDYNIWRFYGYLCTLYSLMQFVSISTAPEDTQALIDYLVILFHNTTSSAYNFSNLSNLLDITQSDSLAHLAILVRG